MNPAIYGKTASILRKARAKAGRLVYDETGQCSMVMGSGKETVDLIASDLAEMFGAESGRFDRELFLKSCQEPS